MGTAVAIADVPAGLFEVLEPPRRLGLMEFARRHVHAVEGPVVDDAGGLPLLWSPAVFPLQETIITAIEDPRWQRVTLMTPPQAFGKTMCAALPVLLHALSQRRMPALYLAGDESLAQKQWSDKIQPALQADPQLRRLLHENPDYGGNWEERKFTNGTSLHFAGGQQPLAAFSVPVIVFDDVQQYPPSLPAGRGHAVDDGLKRSYAFSPDQCTHVTIGTATNVEAWLWRDLQHSAWFLPFVPCPHCGTYQLLEFERLELDEKEVDAQQPEARLRCAEPSCARGIEFAALPDMLTRHKWVSTPPETDWVSNPLEGGTRVRIDEMEVYPETRRNTNVAGFWSNSLYWPHGKTWGQRALDLVIARGNPDQERDQQINDQVRPYQQPEIDEERLTSDELEAHASGQYAAGTVPVAADCVTLAVDVQSGYVYYLARAWRKRDGQSWLIALGTKGKPLRGRDETDQEHQARRVAGITAGLNEVDALAAAGWPRVDARGEVVGQAELNLGLIDRGYEPEAVASWWTLHHAGRWAMIKGQPAGSKRTVLWPMSRRDGLRTDGRGRPWRFVDVNQAKTVLRRVLRTHPEQPGYWQMPGSGLHPNTINAYLRHLTSERWRKDLHPARWEVVTKGVANHFLDCEAYGICAALACGVQLAGLESPVRRAGKKRALPPLRRPRPAIRRIY